MAALDSASSSAASTIGSSSYDVFLNFRGEDTRNNFTGFLYKAMKDRGINVFIDNENLRTGEAIGPTLLRAIEGSKISIPIFSKGYADSKWCLLELAQIVQCQRTNGQLVLPLFFYVEPSHVRNQIGSFEEAFQEHEKNFELHIVESWREALRVVGNLKGIVLDKTKDQAKLVELVVKTVLSELVSSTHLAECKYHIDMESRVNDLLSLLSIGSNDVQFAGICGFGGIGKTTIAKAVYNCILPTFKRHSFLSDIREQATQCMGILSLQKRFLKDIFKIDFDIGDFHRGKKLIEERVCREKVLLVLDDVDSKEQICALAGGLNWFAQGSRIIITTRDEHILNMAKVNKDKIYRPLLLDHEHSLQLFSWHAFQSNQPPEEYMQLSRNVAIHSGGLPLTLEVFGSYLSDLSDKDEWESTLQTLKEIPPEQVQKRLKISYDNLENDYQKAIFLDAACFFIGWKKETVISIWEALGYNPKSTIHVLIKRSLLKFEDDGHGHCYLRIHDQIRDMGREIVLEESRMEPGKHSRLWSLDDILEVLEGHKATDMIKGMSLPLNWLINVTSEHFEMMSNLRFLFIAHANFKGDFSRLPSTLRWFGGKCQEILPTNFYHKKLVHLNLPGSKFKQVWNIRTQDESKHFQNLKVLNLSDCQYLSKSLHFSWFPKLEKLDLDCCISLDELDESIGQLSQLKSLNLKYSIIKKLSESIGDLKSLAMLDLMETQIEELPHNIARMSSLKDLILKSRNSLKKLPESIGDLKSLVKLDLTGTQIEELPQSISKMSSLKELILKSCNSLKKLPDGVGLLEKLGVLDLRGCTKLLKLPRSMGAMRCLDSINLNKMNITKFPDGFSLPPNLVNLEIKSCNSLKKLPESIGDLKSLVKFDLTGTQIEELPQSISKMSSLKELTLKSCNSLKKLPDGVGLLEKLGVLDLRGCTALMKLPRSMGAMRCLDSINLHKMNITKLADGFSLPPNLVNLEMNKVKLECLHVDMSPLKTLKQLKIFQCQKLEYLPALPSSLVELYCENCFSLMQLPNLSKLKILTILKLWYCEKLKEIQGLEGTKSLKEWNAFGCYNLTHSPSIIQVQGTLLPGRLSGQYGYSYSLTANDEIYNNGFILCFVLKLQSIPMYNLKLERGHHPQSIIVNISASIHQKVKKVKCDHTLVIKDVEYTTDHRDIICVHHFKGFDWFGIPLQEKDAVEILDIGTYQATEIL